jgi:hypothetical protein
MAPWSAPAKAAPHDQFRQPLFMAQLLLVVAKTLYPQLPSSDWLASKSESVIILSRWLSGGREFDD